MNVKDLIEVAQSGSPEASLILGVLYEHGLGVETDYLEAGRWYRVAAQAGLVLAQHCYASIAYALGHSDANSLALEWYSRAAKHNFGPSENALGLIYEQGIGVSPDVSLAIEWYSRAARHGSKAAAFHLALIYEQGMGVEKDAIKANEWYMQAAELGDSGAAYIVACKYRDGILGSGNSALALRWFQKAAALNSSEAHAYLAIVYGQGLLGQQIDAEKAAQHFRLASERSMRDQAQRQENRKQMADRIRDDRRT
jgi:TPR repeat protein